jgi:hypothetical protein
MSRRDEDAGRPGRLHFARTCARLVRTSPVIGSVLLVALAGCSQSSSGISSSATRSTTIPSASATTTAVSEQQAILNQYRTFWASLTPVSKMPASQRRAVLEQFTVDPELKSLLAGMLRTDAKGQVFYGADIIRATQAAISPDGVRAVVDDCQDSTHSGNANRATGQRLTVGIARNHVVVTMAKTGGVWKVYFVSHPKTPC